MKQPHDFQPFDDLPSPAALAGYVRRGRQLQAQAVRGAFAMLYRTLRRWLTLSSRSASDDSASLAA